MLRLWSYERILIGNRRFKGLGVGQFRPNLRRRGRRPPTIITRISRLNKCLTTLSLTVFTQRNFVADFFQVKCTFRRFWPKRPFCVLGPLWGLRPTYDVHLRLIGKRVVDFLLVIIELFRYTIGITAAALSARDNRLKIGVFEVTAGSV